MNKIKLLTNQKLQKLHYQKLGLLFTEPKTNERDVLIHAIEQKLKELDKQEWEMLEELLKVKVG
jgi:hypothetical protein